jgi:hypothetical protein
MPSGAAIAASSAAMVTANAANRKAQQAKCEVSMKDFRHEASTIVAQREYAACVRLMHPAEITGGEAIALKAAIVIVMLSAIAGTALGFRPRGNFGPIEGLFLGLIGSGIACILAFAAWSGIGFLFS